MARRKGGKNEKRKPRQTRHTRTEADQHHERGEPNDFPGWSCVWFVCLVPSVVGSAVLQRLVDRMDQAEALPHGVKTPPPPAPQGPQPRENQVVAIERHRVLVEEAGPSQDGREV